MRLSGAVWKTRLDWRRIRDSVSGVHWTKGTNAPEVHATKYGRTVSCIAEFDFRKG